MLGENGRQETVQHGARTASAVSDYNGNGDDVNNENFTHVQTSASCLVKQENKYPDIQKASLPSVQAENVLVCIFQYINKAWPCIFLV